MSSSIRPHRYEHISTWNTAQSCHLKEAKRAQLATKKPKDDATQCHCLCLLYTHVTCCCLSICFALPIISLCVTIVQYALSWSQHQTATNVPMLPCVVEDGDDTTRSSIMSCLYWHFQSLSRTHLSKSGECDQVARTIASCYNLILFCNAIT